MPQAGEPNIIAMAGFVLFIALSLVITWIAARRTHNTEALLRGRPDRSPRCRTASRWPAIT